MKLIFDEMLRNTARWARMAGIDSQIFEGGGDDRLAALARESGRTIVTRDRALAAKCKKQGVQCMLLPVVSLRRQLRIIRQYTGQFGFPAIIRCPLCNATLRLAKKNEVALKLPKRVLKMHRKFWVCGGCGKVYWTGSHWKRIYRILHNLSRPGPAKG
ncbi:MAG: Mut7-C RNAse domain-containing protein [Candidatus Micrarchaeia archaeon]